MAEYELAEEQTGFRRGVSTRDQLFNLRTIMEKAREFNQLLHMAFIDFKKPFEPPKTLVSSEPYGHV